MLLAVIDLGSNSFKMTVAQWAPELNREQPFRVLHKERHSLELGKNVFETGKISPKDFRDGIRAIQKMQMRLRDFSSPILRVVATSAIRDSLNGNEFVDEVRSQLGIPVEVIAGVDEAKLITQGLEWEYSKVGRGLLVDIGGGSTEIAAFGKGWESSFCHSFKMGTVRFSSYIPRIRSESDLTRARKLVRDHFKAEAPQNIEKLIGSAGAIQSLGLILGQKKNNPIIKKSDLDAWIVGNVGMAPRDLVELYDMTPSRARIVLPGAILLSEILGWLGKEEIIVSGITLRDGLLIDLVNNWQVSENQLLQNTLVSRSSPVKSAADKNLLRFLEDLAQHFQADVAYARHVSSLSMSLFDQLRSSGLRFSEDERKYLLIASYLHDVGRLIGDEHYQKHSAYIIQHTKVPGLTPLEIKKCALIALFHREEEPKKSGSLPLEISGKHAMQVRKMCALLRLVTSLDADRNQNIDSLVIKIKKKQALLELVQMRSDPLDLDHFKEQSAYFESLFGLKLISFVHPRRPGLIN